MPLSGCGTSTASHISQAAGKQYGTTEVVCSKRGVAVLVGARTDIYVCDLRGVDLDHQFSLPARDAGSLILHRCFADIDGIVSDVTTTVDRLEAIGQAAGSIGCT